MREYLLETLIYSIDNPLSSLLIALLAGFLSSKIVAADRRPGFLGYTTIGLIGLLLSRFMLSYYQLNQTLDSLREVRFIIDLAAAFLGSFIIAGVIHFRKRS